MPHPYRSYERVPDALPCARPDSLGAALSVAVWFLAAWSLIRLAACFFVGLDPEGCEALAILIAAMSARVQSWARLHECATEYSATAPLLCVTKRRRRA